MIFLRNFHIETFFKKVPFCHFKNVHTEHEVVELGKQVAEHSLRDILTVVSFILK
jgi:hypothetical protein